MTDELYEIKKTARMIIEKIESQRYPFPVKHDKHITYDIHTPHRVWLAKLSEEVFEAQEAVVLGDIAGLAEELQDIIHVCTTWQNAMGYDFVDRQKLCEKVNEKNRLRGYFEEK